MKSSLLDRLRARLFPPVEPPRRASGRPVYERFAIPYSFKPNLSVAEAVIATIATFLRIFLGSLLFAFWGAYSLAALNRIRTFSWRVAVAPVLIVLFLALLALLMLAISALERKLWREGAPRT